MSNERNCAKAIRGIAGNKKYDTFVAKVTAISGASCTAERVIDEKELVDIRLNVSITEAQGIVITPKIDSLILVTTIDGYEWFASQFSEIDKITINAGSIELNGGDNGGLVKAEALVSWMTKVKTDLSAISTALNGLGVAFTPTTPTAKQSDFENDKITH